MDKEQGAFLEDCHVEGLQQYNDLWKKIRQARNDQASIDKKDEVVEMD